VTAAGHPSGGGLSIGAVLDRLRPDFPDVTISKIRFLEAEGLISPERTPSGYRRFSAADCERLRFVLTSQRDHYLPLKVIREQLEAVDRGASPEGPVVRLPRTFEASAEPFADAGDSGRVSHAELIERTGAKGTFVDDLVKIGFLASGPGGYFDIDAVVLVRTAKAMMEFGLELRHLRAFKMSADREGALLAQIAGPVARGREAGARDRAEEIVRELGSLLVTLHGALVKRAVHEALDG
jgi:DNA-binding transcriptional MerR regulator